MSHDDLIIEDVRNTREKLFEKYNYDLKKFLKHIREEDKKYPDSIAKDIKPCNKLPDFLKPLGK